VGGLPKFRPEALNDRIAPFAVIVRGAPERRGREETGHSVCDRE
jgi:hypothetical protein